MARRARSALFCLAASTLACGGPPRIDTSSDQTTKASLERVRESLPAEKRAAFDAAVMTVALGRLGRDASLPGKARPDVPEARLLAPLNGMTAAEVLTEARRIVASRREAQHAEGGGGARSP